MKVQTVGGIDPSSKKIVIVETRASNKSKPFIHICHLRSENPEENCSDAFDFVVEYAMNVRERDDGQSPRLYLEAPVMGGGGSQKTRPGPTISQSFVSGSIMAAAAQTECKIALINNSTWKKRILGNGNIAKEDIGGVIKEVWPELYKAAPLISAKQHNGKIPNNMPDQDVLDAGGINLFGWRNVDLVERITKRRKANG